MKDDYEDTYFVFVEGLERPFLASLYQISFAVAAHLDKVQRSSLG